MKQYIQLDHPPEVYPAIAKVGLLALATDYCIEDDLRQLLPRGLGVFTNRISNRNPITIESLTEMRGDISRAAAALLPSARPDCYVYGCTSGTAAIGYDNICRDIHAATGHDVPIITPLIAAFDALHALRCQCIVLLTPYLPEVSQTIADHFSDAGFTVAVHGYLGIGDDYQVTCVTPQQWLVAAQKLCQGVQADALFVSCTAARASSILQPLKDTLGIPVLCSNQCLADAVCRSLKIPPL